MSTPQESINGDLERTVPDFRYDWDQESGDIIEELSGIPDETMAPSVDERGPVGRFFVNIPMLIIGLIISIVALVVFLTLDIQRSTAQSGYVQIAANLSTLSQRLARESREAVMGIKVSFIKVNRTIKDFSKELELLTIGDDEAGIDPTPDHNRPQVTAVSNIWKPVRQNAERIVSNEKVVMDTFANVKRINEISPRLLAQSDEVVSALVKEGEAPEVINTAGLQRTLSQRIAKNASLFALNLDGATVAATQVGKDVKLFAATQNQIRESSSTAVRAKLDRLDQTFSELEKSATVMLDGTAEFFVTQRSAQYVVQNSDRLLGAIRGLVSDLSMSPEQQFIRWLPWVFGGLIVVFVVMVGRALVVEARERVRSSTEQNRQTQDAILKLLDEMGNLADGDLTIEAEVTDQITGAIADSVNFAIREMRGLVESINRISKQVAVESGRTREAAERLTGDSRRHADEITSTSERLTTMARSMDEMSEEARRSEEVAQGSTAVAKRGADQVRKTIQGMDELREQIQNTAKRIKRLGESSQQISEAVELIEDIADQTNVLSLNAAIQAAMAGEAGRGFAVVAEEVQRLAERSAQATKQIAELVNVIQTDTNEAVVSMEGATRGVVEGARVADVAGQALNEIESVSEELSGLIGSMANAAQSQSETATNVSSQMNKIREGTEASSEGVLKTADSIGQLAELARELELSVAGFKLP